MQPSDNSQWTRVFSRDCHSDKKLPLYTLGPDLLYDRSIRDSLGEAINSTGEILFSPFMFNANDLSQDLTQNEVPLADLLRLGKAATKIKARFTRAVDDTAAEDSAEA